jgi:hypothetical protein
MPSHVDLRTQLQYQQLDSDFVGLIFSCYEDDRATHAGAVRCHAFQTEVDGATGAEGRRHVAVQVSRERNKTEQVRRRAHLFVASYREKVRSAFCLLLYLNPVVIPLCVLLFNYSCTHPPFHSEQGLGDLVVVQDSLFREERDEFRQVIGQAGAEGAGAAGASGSGGAGGSHQPTPLALVHHNLTYARALTR